MSTNPHNIPAYPTAVRAFSREGIPTADSTPGMSLLDYFAGQALIGLIAEHANPASSGSASYNHAEQLHAARAYAIADAMLAERAKRREQK